MAKMITKNMLNEFPKSIPGLLVGTDRLGYQDSYFRTPEDRAARKTEIESLKTEWKIIETETVRPDGETLPPSVEVDTYDGHIHGVSREMNDWVMAVNGILNTESRGR